MRTTPIGIAMLNDEREHGVLDDVLETARVEAVPVVHSGILTVAADGAEPVRFERFRPWTHNV